MINVCVPSCAVTCTVIRLVPEVSAIAAEDAPLGTATPITRTVAAASIAVGVIRTELFAPVIVATYAAVSLANAGASAPSETASPASLALVPHAPVVNVMSLP